MTQSNRYCTKPFSHFEVSGEGNAFLCCPSWLKTSIGDVKKESFENIWNSANAQKIRESIIDGSYRYCDKDLCPYLQSSFLKPLDELPEVFQKMIGEKQTVLEEKPEYVLLAYDQSCNLSCPSCRKEKIMTPLGSPEHLKYEGITEKIHRELVMKSDRQMILNITGSGDPFASNVYRQYLENLKGKDLPHLKIDLQTNAVLFTPKMWERMEHIHSNIRNVFVSIDAAAEETYKVVRRDGNWPVLLNNMKFLAELRRQKKINLLQARFVVQKSNYREMESFARLFLGMGCDVIEFAQVVDWGTWGEREFKEQCVWEKNHPERGEFLRAVSAPFLSHERIFLGNLTAFHEEGVQFQLGTLPFFERQIFRLRLFLQTTENVFIRRCVKISKRMLGLFRS